MHTLAAFGPADWIVVAAYFALVSIVGLAVARRDAAQTDYFLGNRSMPTWAVSLSLVATMLSTATFVGVPDAAFGGDLSYLGLSIGGIIAVFVVAWFFVPRLYAAHTITIYGFLAQRFGEPSRIAVSAAFIVGRMLASGARLFLAAIPLCLLLFGNAFPSVPQLVLAIALIGAVGTFYTAIGGVRAVVWVDVIQLAIVIGTAAMTIAILLHRIPLSLPAIVSALAHTPAAPGSATSKLHLLDFSADLSKPYTVLAALFGIAFLNIAAFGTDQDLAQRFLITKSARGGARSVIASQFIGMAVVFLFLCLGLLLYIFYQRPDLTGDFHQASADGRSVYPWFLLTELPTGVAGIAVAGFFAIAQGSLDSAMNALASSIVADVWMPLRKHRHETPPAGHASRWVVAGVGAALCAFAILCAALYNPVHRTLLDYVQGVMTFALSGMLGVFCTALFTRRGNSRSVIAALIVGPLAVVAVQEPLMRLWTPLVFGRTFILAWPWWMAVGFACSFVVCLTGKGKTPAQPQDSAAALAPQ